jgi:NADH:ubiquinone oxidoreductase subunit 6 (subunit J)
MDLFFNLLFVPVAYASVDSFIASVNRMIINPLIVLLFVLAVAYFAWGVFQFLTNQDNEEQKTSGKRHMLWGIVGITIMMGVWTLLNIILNTFNIPKSEIDPENNNVKLRDYNPTYPQVGN